MDYIIKFLFLFLFMIDEILQLTLLILEADGGRKSEKGYTLFSTRLRPRVYDTPTTYTYELKDYRRPYFTTS